MKAELKPETRPSYAPLPDGFWRYESSEPRQLWWGRLNSASPRYASWLNIFGTDRAALLAPFEREVDFIGVGKVYAYVLNLEELTAEQIARLVQFVVKKFGAPAVEVQAELKAKGYPILPEDIVSICVEETIR